MIRTESVRLLGRGAALALARLRFLLLVGGVLALIAYWPTLRIAAERLMRPIPPADAISADTEYWCPMCPGVTSDWPNKCPVCHMTLVRRQKGEMTPLPDGVIARVQLSPYRLQLAGIRTSAAEYRKLEREITVGGRLERADGPAQFVLGAEPFDADAALLTPGLEAEISCDACPGETFAGHVATAPAEPRRDARLRISVDDPMGRLRSGAYAAARFRLAESRQPTHRDAAVERWRNQTAVEMLATGAGQPAALGSLLESGVRLALLREGMILTVPESAVIDTGERQVVFVEQGMPGAFDAVEVRLGRRCGDFYPVRSGLESGQRVVTAGAVLLDAETRLNPSVAASYFGAGSRTPGAPAPPPPSGTLSPEDRALADRQKICPVTEASLDSMGGPVRVMVNGKPVFICCEGCRDRLLKSPAKYLSKLAGK